MDLTYRVLRLAAAAASRVPLRLGYFLAGCSGDILFLLSPGRRNIVAGNMRRVLGAEADNGKLRRAARGVFKTMSRNYFDLTKLSQFRLERLDGMVRIEGWRHLTEAVTNPKGTIIASAHLGNFDFAVHVLGLRGIGNTIFVEASDASPFLRLIAELRGKSSCRTLPVCKGTIRNGLEILRRGGTVTVVGDRDVQGNGLKIKFFGEETTLPFGAVSLALRTGATILPVFGVRESGSRSVIHIEPPLILVDEGDRASFLKANVERLAAVMERYIRQYPEQWVAVEPVWK